MNKLYLRLLSLVDKLHEGSQTAFAKDAGLNQSTFWGYLSEQGQSKIRLSTIEKILDAFPQISRDWLYFGEGEMFRNAEKNTVATPAVSTPEPTIYNQPIPMVGLASCGVQGMEQIMPYAVAVSPIRLSPHALAVVASGESMIPAGIGSGHICYCDPEQKPVPGEAVFLRQKDGLGALKLFLGQGERAGTTRFKGWLNPTDTGAQKEFMLDVANEVIDCIAPVILIRRRV